MEAIGKRRRMRSAAVRNVKSQISEIIVQGNPYRLAITYTDFVAFFGISHVKPLLSLRSHVLCEHSKHNRKPAALNHWVRPNRTSVSALPKPNVNPKYPACLGARGRGNNWQRHVRSRAVRRCTHA